MNTEFLAGKFFLFFSFSTFYASLQCLLASVINCTDALLCAMSPFCLGTSQSFLITCGFNHIGPEVPNVYLLEYFSPCS